MGQKANTLLEVKRYIQATYPFWNRTQVRHMGAGGGIRGVQGGVRGRQPTCCLRGVGIVMGSVAGGGGRGQGGVGSGGEAAAGGETLHSSDVPFFEPHAGEGGAGAVASVVSLRQS